MLAFFTKIFVARASLVWWSHADLARDPADWSGQVGFTCWRSKFQTWPGSACGGLWTRLGSTGWLTVRTMAPFEEGNKRSFQCRCVSQELDLHGRRCLAELAHKVRVSGSMDHGCTRTSPCAAAPHLAKKSGNRNNGHGRYSLRQYPTACLAQRGEVERGAAGLVRAHTPRRALLRWQHSPNVPRQTRQFDLLGRWGSVELARLVRFCGVQASPLVLIWRHKVEATVEERAVLVEQQYIIFLKKEDKSMLS